MKVLFITNILLQINRISSLIRDKGIELKAFLLNNTILKNLTNLLKEFDLIILDLPTPYLKELVNKIRETEKNKPIIVLGNEENYKDIIEISKIGISKYLKKPFDPGILEKYIKEVIISDEINERSQKKGFAIYTRNINKITIINILGYLQQETVEEVKKIIENSEKVAISLNGISSMSLDVNALKEISNILKNKGDNYRIILVREKIKNILVEEGIKESLIYPNEFLAIKSF